MNYEIIKAKSPEEARDKSKFKEGDLVRIEKIVISANHDGTYTSRVVELTIIEATILPN